MIGISGGRFRHLFRFAQQFRVDGDLTAFFARITKVILSVVAKAGRRKAFCSAPVIFYPLTLHLAYTIRA